MTNASLSQIPTGFINKDCSMVPIIVFLNDHKADTLKRVIASVKTFSDDNPQDGIEFLLAAGNAGIEASTNMVIEEAQTEMLLWVYAVVTIICLITFRSIPIVLCIIIPLIITSILSQALMALLGIGVKVATLPVIALGVGIGVDYGIYIFSKIKEGVAMNKSLYMSYLYTLNQTGKAVAFTGVTLAICVATWAFSPIKFQADMGLLLTFMFAFNMIGALTLIPALAWLFGIGKKKEK
jgi:Predicted exporters of the RND superfamily